MTRRILAGFLGVLVAVIVAMVVPLGLVVTAQQHRDFVESTRTAARGLAAVAEEQLDDHATSVPLPALLTGASGHGDRVAVLDRNAAIVAASTPPPPARVILAARNRGRIPQPDGRVVVTAPVGDADRSVGTVILVRDAAPVQQRARNLWLALAAAASAALIVGAALGWSLGRWISRPLRSLVTAAHGIGTGHPEARADQTAGPVQVREVAQAFNDMADRVGALVETQRGMTAEVSHQLRTPLAALRLRLELIAEDADGDAREEALAMLTEINRLARLVDGLLAVARAEATQSAPVPTDVGQLVRERLDAWEPVAVERGVTLEPRISNEPTLASLTPGHLDQILDNLLANAIDAVPSRGRITVSVTDNRGTPVLRVDDTGPGMSSQQRARAFAPFTTDRGGHGGSGLGLAIVARLVATDHGTISLHPAPAGGTRAQIVMQSVPGS